MGGLAIDGCELIGQKPLESAGRMASNARKSLDLAANALAGGNPVSEEAVVTWLNPMFLRGSIFFAGRGWKSLAKRNGAQERLYDRPYEAK